MRLLPGKLSLLLVAAIMIAALFITPTSLFAQGRGRGRGLDKKSTKFINGHDARDGRWDGRGPRPNFLGVTTRSRIRSEQRHRRIRRHRYLMAERHRRIYRQRVR
jgi:hypothetical protein